MQPGAETNATAGPVTGSSQFPAGLDNAFYFAAFNALSFQVVLSSPMVLYAKSLGASATILGLIVGMMPLLVIFQIPAASYIPRVGFKRFVYAGWGTRVMFIFGMALVPLTGSFLESGNRLALLLGLLFCFNLSRGISSCAWLPWITALVPAPLRGKYLARDAAVQSVSSFFTFLLAAAFLAGNPGAWQFSVLFAFSAVAGAISLSFLKRIPDAPVTEEMRSSSKAPVPWMAMFNHPPFKKLIVTVVGWSIGYGGITAFTVAFLRVQAGMSEGQILLISSVFYIGGLSSLWFLGSRLDHLGSRPVLVFCMAAWFAVLAGWTILAGGGLPIQFGIVLGLQFCMGLLAALVQMANTRLAMIVVPEMGRNHFFAMYSVLTNVTLGVAPIAWGLMIDLVGGSSATFAGLTWNRYAIFFGGAALTLLVTLLLARRLEEDSSVSMEELLREILIHSPQRLVLFFRWPRG